MDDITPQMDGDPIFLQSFHGNALKFMDHRLDPFGAPLVSVGNRSITKVISHDIGPVHVGEHSSHGQRPVDFLVDILRQDVHESDGKMHQEILEGALPVLRRQKARTFFSSDVCHD